MNHRFFSYFIFKQAFELIWIIDFFLIINSNKHFSSFMTNTSSCAFHTMLDFELSWTYMASSSLQDRATKWAYFLQFLLPLKGRLVGLGGGGLKTWDKNIFALKFLLGQLNLNLEFGHGCTKFPLPVGRGMWKKLGSRS